MKLRTYIPPKPYVRIEIFRKANDNTTESLMIEDATLEEVIDWSKDIIIDVVKRNIVKSITINTTTKIVVREYNVIDCTPTSNNRFLGKKIQPGKNKRFKTIGVSPNRIKNAMLKNLNQ